MLFRCKKYKCCCSYFCVFNDSRQNSTGADAFFLNDGGPTPYFADTQVPSVLPTDHPSVLPFMVPNQIWSVRVSTNSIHEVWGFTTKILRKLTDSRGGRKTHFRNGMDSCPDTNGSSISHAPNTATVWILSKSDHEQQIPWLYFLPAGLVWKVIVTLQSEQCNVDQDCTAFDFQANLKIIEKFDVIIIIIIKSNS